jgi:NAD(P)-dependent dehydrogenase (short-subunit alcohol dehydrogenase family)
MKNRWTFNNIPDLSGKTIIVTGGNCGLGYEAVKAFAAKGAKVILACRSVGKGKAAKEEIIEKYPKAKIDVMKLDLADLKSVREFAAEFKKKYKRLDVLLNNAGVMMCPYGKTKDGLEMQLGTNHFGHYALTGLLLDHLKKTPKSRIVNVSSMGHRFGSMDFDNLMFEKGKYDPMRAYGRSKLANLLFTYELQRRLDAHKSGIIAMAAHPGGSATNLGRHLEKNFFLRMLKPIAFGMLAQPASIGALPEIRASVDPDVKGGEYYGPEGFKELRGYPIRVESNQASHNVEDAGKLWKLSEELTGVRFRF